MTIAFKQPLVRLPIRFDTAALAAEVAALPRSAWVPHPNKFPGNDAVRLISTGGKPTDAFDGAQAPT
ncbi:MAG: aspartyl beta-hydroxylase, partial [Sphingomicrobium sp.]